jgi:hypothetical protein
MYKLWDDGRYRLRVWMKGQRQISRNHRERYGLVILWLLRLAEDESLFAALVFALPHDLQQALDQQPCLPTCRHANTYHALPELAEAVRESDCTSVQRKRVTIEGELVMFAAIGEEEYRAVIVVDRRCVRLNTSYAVGASLLRRKNATTEKGCQLAGESSLQCQGKSLLCEREWRVFACIGVCAEEVVGLVVWVKQV